MSDRTPESERIALSDMLSSEGWAIYMQHVEQAWGASACETALRTARQNCDPSEWPFESTRILDTFAGIRADLQWPVERVRSLKHGASARQTMTDAFATLRRGPKRA